LGADAETEAGIGTTAMASASWVSAADIFQWFNQPVYALSDVLVVSP
jgi:hypothetical protein